MAFLSRYFNQIRMSKRKYAGEVTSDQPLNTRDYSRNLNQDLRRLNLERAFVVTPLILLGAGIGLLLTRRYKMAALAITGFLAQETLIGSRAARKLPSSTQPEEMDLEQYAVKAERGDYGKLDVIPFR